MGGDTAFLGVSLYLNFLICGMKILLMVFVKIDNLCKKVSSVLST